MNTPTHLVMNLALLGSARQPRLVAPILLGSILPDAGMFVFYGVQKLLGTPEATIWGVSYFQANWQAFFNATNSLPLITVGLVLCLTLGTRWFTALFLSMELHCIGDIFLHHDDGHGHFWPLSMWHFESPVSYWDPVHYGLWWMPVEILLYAGSLWALRRRHTGRWARRLIALALALVVPWAALWMVVLYSAP